MSCLPGQAAGLAVVGDGSAGHGAETPDPGEVLTALTADVRLLRDHGLVTAFPVAVSVRDANQLSSALRALPPGTTAIFLARTAADRLSAPSRSSPTPASPRS
ncbi:hypothetical protein [Amycolatopsis alkalitolerans]|uniref:hypothetical protein n=1 Tax=Amycolatopsis alkalitolerans TaxID=2547244 RepID=UPI001F408933|nr:hypothetical protein [Amycolatopsis alkalitolerans]